MTGTRVRTGTLELFEIRAVISELSDRHHGAYATVFEPPPIDHRIANQSGILAFWSPTDPDQPMDEWLEDHPEFSRRIVIPAERKQEFRDKLDKANVNHRTFFPGLDGLATWLTEYYKPIGSNDS